MADDHHIVVNSISVVELVYAAEKAKNPLTGDQRDHILAVLDEDDSPFLVVPTTPAMAPPWWRSPVPSCRILLIAASRPRPSRWGWPSLRLTSGSGGLVMSASCTSSGDVTVGYYGPSRAAAIRSAASRCMSGRTVA